VDSQLGVADLLTKYVALHEEHFGRKPKYIRPFLAFSDSSLSSSLLAGALGNKLALARLHEFARKSGIPVFPIAGPGSLHFRGGLKPNDTSIRRFLTEFPGVRTVTVQSSFRYDHPLDEVKAAIKKLEEALPDTQPASVGASTQKQLLSVIKRSTEFYQSTLDDIGPGMQRVFTQIPKRRDRRQHIGLLAYSRSMHGQELPRAITFTAGFYSVGVPPEFIGFGRTLKALSPKELTSLHDIYPSLTADYEAAGRYLNIDNLKKFAAGSDGWKAVLQDVQDAQEVLGVTFGPRTADEKRHAALSAELTSLPDDSDGSKLITQLAELRKSLG
jgi:phosphoenolpyruvate carboxylase